MALTSKNITDIQDIVECEGFDYGFTHYTSFDDIKDKKFHELRLKFLAARIALVDYCELEDV